MPSVEFEDDDEDMCPFCGEIEEVGHWCQEGQDIRDQWREEHA